jgi:predicted phosphodiesterase
MVAKCKDTPLADSINLLHEAKRKEVVRLVPPLKAQFDAAIVLTDVHIPFHSEKWMEMAIRRGYELGKEHAKTVCLIGGDLMDLCMFGDYGHNDKDSSARKTIEDTAYILRALYQVFDEIYICQGNHDLRFTKAIKGKLGFDELMDMIRYRVSSHILMDHLHTSPRNFILCQDNTWAIVHPKNYSKIATTVPRKLAELHQMNIIGGHTHHPPSFASTSNGKFVGLENGCIQDRSVVSYLKDMDLFPQHMYGFTELIKCPDGKTRFRQISEQDLNL